MEVILVTKVEGRQHGTTPLPAQRTAAAHLFEVDPKVGLHELDFSTTPN
jgi:hypothetical protein